jgi:hypothetical protein
MVVFFLAVGIVGGRNFCNTCMAGKLDAFDDLARLPDFGITGWLWLAEFGQWQQGEDKEQDN